MKDRIISLTEKYFSNVRIYDDEDLDYLLELDDSFSKIYSEHRRYSFELAARLARTYVLHKIWSDNTK